MQEEAKTPLLGMTIEQLRTVVGKYGLKPFAAGQIASWLYVKRVKDIE